MNTDQIKRIQDSWARVRPHSQEAMDAFYARAFEIAPGARALFQADLAEQKAVLASMLNTVVCGLSYLDDVVEEVRELGARHRGYGATPELYDEFGGALIETLRAALGDDFDRETEDAWRAAYTLLAREMQAGAHDAAA